MIHTTATSPASAYEKMELPTNPTALFDQKLISRSDARTLAFIGTDEAKHPTIKPLLTKLYTLSTDTKTNAARKLQATLTALKTALTEVRQGLPNVPSRNESLSNAEPETNYDPAAYTKLFDGTEDEMGKGGLLADGAVKTGATVTELLAKTGSTEDGNGSTLIINELLSF